MAFLVTGFAELGHALILPGELVVYVGDRPYPSDFDPYYNQPKIYRQPRKQEDQREESVQDYKGEGPIRSHGLQKDHLSQDEEKEEVVRTHEILFFSLRAPAQRGKRICVRSGLHAGEPDRPKL